VVFAIVVDLPELLATLPFLSKSSTPSVVVRDAAETFSDCVRTVD
jgi:hypothetical protein